MYLVPSRKADFSDYTIVESLIKLLTAWVVFDLCQQNEGPLRHPS